MQLTNRDELKLKTLKDLYNQLIESNEAYGNRTNNQFRTLQCILLNWIEEPLYDMIIGKVEPFKLLKNELLASQVYQISNLNDSTLFYWNKQMKEYEVLTNEALCNMIEDVYYYINRNGEI